MADSKTDNGLAAKVRKLQEDVDRLKQIVDRASQAMKRMWDHDPRGEGWVGRDAGDKDYRSGNSRLGALLITLLLCASIAGAFVFVNGSGTTMIQATRNSTTGYYDGGFYAAGTVTAARVSAPEYVKAAIDVTNGQVVTLVEGVNLLHSTGLPAGQTNTITVVAPTTPGTHAYIVNTGTTNLLRIAQGSGWYAPTVEVTYQDMIDSIARDTSAWDCND